jgi:hypothetical protein
MDANILVAKWKLAALFQPAFSGYSVELQMFVLAPPTGEITRSQLMSRIYHQNDGKCGLSITLKIPLSF